MVLSIWGYWLAGGGAGRAIILILIYRLRFVHSLL